MNKISFVDELVKIGALRPLYKRADESRDVNTADIPAGMISHDPIPEHMPVRPDQAATRLPRTAALPSAVEVITGTLGNVTQPRDPIDREKYNRAYRDRR